MWRASLAVHLRAKKPGCRGGVGKTVERLQTNMLKWWELCTSTFSDRASVGPEGGLNLTQEIQITLETDDQGMIGRQCPDVDCGKYFKLKPGTSPYSDSGVTRCPYCETEGASDSFLTDDQREYAISVVTRDVVDPLVKKFAKDIGRLNRRQPRSLIGIDISVKYDPPPVYKYMEKHLETEVTCNQCSLEFAVYGVFASCPNCGRLNALTVLLSSLEITKKMLVLSTDENLDQDLRYELLKDALNGPVGVFDAYGKVLRARTSKIRSNAKPNLFQDIETLDSEMQAVGVPGVEQLIGNSKWEDLKWFFQARHIYSHNAGVVDDRFIAKQPAYAYMRDRLLPLDPEQIDRNIDVLGLLATELDSRIN